MYAFEVVANPGMHVHRVNVVLKCSSPDLIGPAEQNSRRPIRGPAAVHKTTSRPSRCRRVWRHAHQFTRPELVGEVAKLLRRCGVTVRPATASHPHVMLPSVDTVFHRYTRQVILALPHTGAPGRPRVRREVAHA